MNVDSPRLPPDDKERFAPLEVAHTEMSFEEMRGSMLEGCCPGDSVAAGALSLLTAAVTPTMLSLPLAFSVGGVRFALGSTLVCILMTLASVRILAFASASAQSDDYETVSGFFFGPRGRWATRLILFFYNFGCSVVYLRFIYDSFTPILALYGSSLPPWMSGPSGSVIGLVMFVLFVTPLTFNSRLSSLRTKGLISNVLITFIVCAVAFRYFNPIGDTDTSRHQVKVTAQPEVTNLSSLWKWLLPYFFSGPIFVFAYEVQSNVMAVFRDLYDPSPRRILTCIVLALAGATVFYIPLGLFGSWSFPNSTSGNLLSNYDIEEDRLMMLCQLCCCFSAAVAFVFVLFPCRFAFFMLISDGSSQKVPHAYRVRIGILLSAISCFLALFVPDVAVVVSVLGACCSSTLSMTMPALFALKMGSSGTYCTTKTDRIIAWLMLVGGVGFSIIGTAMALLLGM